MFRCKSEDLGGNRTNYTFFTFFSKNVQFLKKLLLRLALMLWVMRMRTPATDKGTVTAAMDYATVTEDSRTPKP